ncbi:MAG: hypothetical protein HKP55_01850 [Gammaproteobacteria bacterium]|nr:PepSY domain-containing protein [Gammaproteobacteria bacterium]NNJ90393.1 hypothetical protein [Gammaproteobacteria bacterium]
MFKNRKNYILRTLVATMLMAGLIVFYSWLPVFASDDHDEVRDLKNRGEIIALYELINKAGLTEVKILEAELEREHGKLVYELEFLDAEGRVFEQYFDAMTGDPLTEPRRD